MTTLSRRAFFTRALGCATVLTVLPACTTMKVGTVTTITIEVAKVKQYASAGLSAIQTVETALAFVPSLSAEMATFKVVTTMLQTALNAFTAVAADNIVLTYNDASVKSSVDSVLTAMRLILTEVGDVFEKMLSLGFSVGNETISSVQLVKSALSTVITVFESLLGTALPLSTSWPSSASFNSMTASMSETRALKILSA